VRRNVVLVGVWLAGTVVAMVLAALAVQFASAKVTDHPTAVISRPQLDAELDAARSASSTTSTAFAAGGPSTVPVDDVTVPDPNDRSDDGSHPEPGGGPSTVLAPPTTAPRSAPPSTQDDHGGPDGGGPGGGGPGGGPAPTSPPPTSVPATEKQFTLTGGWVRVRCQGAVASLVASSPSSGFTMEVKATGPQVVEVRFASSDHESRFKAHCDNGTIVVDEQRETADD
jgi:hypothetical protein